MEDNVIVNKSEIEKLISREQDKNEWGDLIQGCFTYKIDVAELRTLLDQSTPVSGDVVGYIDDTGFFTKDPYEHPHKFFNAVYTTPQPAPDKVPVEKYNRAIIALQGAKEFFDSDGDISDSSEREIINLISNALAEAIKGE